MNLLTNNSSSTNNGNDSNKCQLLTKFIIFQLAKDCPKLKVNILLFPLYIIISIYSTTILTFKFKYTILIKYIILKSNILSLSHIFYLNLKYFILIKFIIIKYFLNLLLLLLSFNTNIICPFEITLSLRWEN